LSGVPPEVFDEDYLHFYADVLGDERSDADAETVARLLALEPGTRVLDAPCGHGRIAGRLARLGCEVFGIDASARFLELARERYPEVRFERGDLRALGHDGEFDAAVNWFTSFGYFDRATNDGVLAGFARALRPGGRLLVELHNPERLRRVLELSGGTTAAVIERDGDLLVDRIAWDPAEAERSLTERWIVRGGRTRKLEFSLEQIPAAKLVERLRAAGFREVELYGAGGAPFDPDGPRLLAVART
jgi:SAM-dependent methyltransferase